MEQNSFSFATPENFPPDAYAVPSGTREFTDSGRGSKFEIFSRDSTGISNENRTSYLIARKTGGSKTPIRIKPKALTASKKINLGFKTPNVTIPIREKIDVKLMWFIHGSEKTHADIPAFSERSMAHKKKIPKITFGPCHFDSLSFFSPGGHYANFSPEVAINIGTLMCNNQTEGKFEKIPDSNGYLELRDMEFAVEPQTDPDFFKQGMSVYLCVKGHVTRIHDYNDLIRFGTFDMERLISESNTFMANLGFSYRKWDLLLCCCRVYQPNIVMDKYGLVYNVYAPSYEVMPSAKKMANRRAASSIEKAFGIPLKKINQLKKELSYIRKPKTTRSEFARKTVRLSIPRGGSSNKGLTQVSESEFYKSLSPITIKPTKQNKTRRIK